MADVALYEEYLDLPLDAPANLHGFALDIGASLTKLVLVVDGPKKPEVVDGRQSSVRLRLMTFQNDRLEQVLKVINEDGLPEDRTSTPLVIMGYGHGVQRARDVINNTLGVTIDYTDEFTSFGRGFHHLFTHMPLEEFLHPEEGAIPKVHIDDQDKFPLILNFLGSAIIFLSIKQGPDGKPKVAIVEGMQRGGLYFLCMNKMLLGTKEFPEVMNLIEEGNSKNVNMTAKGKDGTETTAFPLGRIWKEDISSPNREDLAAAFFETMCDDIRLVASNAMNVAKAKSIYFAGSFAKDNKKFREVMKTLPDWEVKHGRTPVMVGFPKYEGYIGAIGAFVLGVEKLANPDTQLTQLDMDMSNMARVMTDAGMSPQEMAQMAQMMGGGGPPGEGATQGGGGPPEGVAQGATQS